MNRSDHILHLKNIRDGFRALLREPIHATMQSECRRQLAKVEADLKELEGKN